jgi:hypothetical protein
MKRLKLLVGFLVALVILGGMSAPTASAQPLHPLDGVWLKCKVNAKGYAVNPDTGVYRTANGSIPAYLHFVYDSANSWYDVSVWTNIGGDWLKTFDTAPLSGPDNKVFPSQPGENFISDFFLQFQVNATDNINTYHTPFISYKFKDGKVTKVIYKGTGEVQKGSVNGGTMDYYGYFNISGSSVDVTKLPFTP